MSHTVAGIKERGATIVEGIKASLQKEKIFNSALFWNGWRKEQLTRIYLEHINKVFPGVEEIKWKWNKHGERGRLHAICIIPPDIDISALKVTLNERDILEIAVTYTPGGTPDLNVTGAIWGGGENGARL